MMREIYGKGEFRFCYLVLRATTTTTTTTTNTTNNNNNNNNNNNDNNNNNIVIIIMSNIKQTPGFYHFHVYSRPLNETDSFISSLLLNFLNLVHN